MDGNQNNKLNIGANILIVLRVILFIVVLIFGVGFIDYSIGSYTTSSANAIDSVTISAFNSRFLNFVWNDYSSASETRYLINMILAHNSNEETTSSYGTISIYYYGLDESGDIVYDPVKNNSSDLTSVIKTTQRYKIEVHSYSLLGAISAMRIIELDQNKQNNRTFEEASSNPKITKTTESSNLIIISTIAPKVKLLSFFSSIETSN